MKMFLGVAAASVIALPIAASSPGAAQAPPDLFNPQIEVEYVQPKNAKFKPVYDRLKNRKALETLRQFLAPLKLKPQTKLVVKLDQCDARTVRYKKQGPVTVCYEYVEEIRRLAPKSSVELIQTQSKALDEESAIVGPFVQAVLHEVALAIFDVLEVPVWGRAEDAADRVAAYILLKFGDDVAWNAVVGTAWFMAGNALSAPDLADTRGVMAQRYYTTLCIAFGAEPETFGSFVAERRGGLFGTAAAAGDLPPARARGCREEFETIEEAFAATILPHIDTALLAKVQKVKWVFDN
jgi:hypothetical protein